MLDVIDAHAHLSLNVPPDDLINQMDMTSVDAAVILPVVTEKDVPSYNDFIAHTVEEFPDRLIGFGYVNPQEKKAVEELNRFPDLGLKGVKLNPILQRFHCNTKEMDVIAEKAGDLRITVLVHSYFPYNSHEAEGLYTLIGNHPRTTFVLAHAGGPSFLECYAYVERRNTIDNAYFDVSSTPIVFKRGPYREHFKWFLEKMGADRVIFGSDYPHHQLVDALTAFDELGLSFKDSQQILGKTAATLLDL